MPKVWWRASQEAYRVKFAMTDLKDKLDVKNMETIRIFVLLRSRFIIKTIGVMPLEFKRMPFIKSGL